MNRLTKCIITCLVLLFAFQGVCSAYTKNGITVTVSGSRWYRYLSAPIQSTYNATATATFNDAGGTTGTSGAINVVGYDRISIQMRVTTLGSTGVDFDIEGSNEPSISTSTVWGHIYTMKFDATTTKDTILPVEEAGTIRWIRVSTQATGSISTDDISSFISASGRIGSQ